MHFAIGGNPWAIARKNVITSSTKTKWLWSGVRIASTGAEELAGVTNIHIMMKMNGICSTKTISVLTEKGNALILKR